MFLKLRALEALTHFIIMHNGMDVPAHMSAGQQQEQKACLKLAADPNQLQACI